MSEDPFRQITSFRFYRRESAQLGLNGWRIQASPVIAVLWVAAMFVGAVAGVSYFVIPPLVFAFLPIILGLLGASAAYHFWETQTFSMEIRPDGIRVHHDRLSWREIERFEARSIDVQGGPGTILMTISGLILHTAAGPLCFPTRAELVEVEELAHRLELLRVQGDEPLPDDARRVLSLREAEKARGHSATDT